VHRALALKVEARAVGGAGSAGVVAADEKIPASEGAAVHPQRALPTRVEGEPDELDVGVGGRQQVVGGALDEDGAALRRLKDDVAAVDGPSARVRAGIDHQVYGALGGGQGLGHGRIGLGGPHGNRLRPGQAGHCETHHSEQPTHTPSAWRHSILHRGHRWAGIL